MKEKIREIMWDFVAGEVTDSEAVQQVLDLFAVAGRSEQLGNCSFCNNKSVKRDEDGFEFCSKCLEA